MATAATEWPAYLRADGRKGIRNVVAVAYLVECAHHVAREIAAPFGDRGCTSSASPAATRTTTPSRMLRELCTHPNVGAVLLVSLGCESLRRATRSRPPSPTAAGRWRRSVIQEHGGTRSTVAAGREWVQAQLAARAGERVRR